LCLIFAIVILNFSNGVPDKNRDKLRSGCLSRQRQECEHLPYKQGIIPKESGSLVEEDWLLNFVIWNFLTTGS
jgi:hypothetical protein